MGGGKGIQEWGDEKFLKSFYIVARGANPRFMKTPNYIAYILPLSSFVELAHFPAI